MSLFVDFTVRGNQTEKIWNFQHFGTEIGHCAVYILVDFIVILLSQRPATFCSLENKDKEQAKQNYWTTKVQAK